MNLQELVVPFILDDKNFNSGIEGAITKGSTLGTILGNLATSAISGAFNLLGQGIQKVKGFLADTVNEATASQDAIAQLEAVLKSTGGASGVTSQQAQDLASSLQKVTKFSDEAILGGENMLLTFTSIGKEIFPQATETILDMSQALGQDLKSSAIQLGKALNDPITGVTALRRVGVQFSDEQEEMIKKLVESGQMMEAQKFILEELKTEFGGSAVAAGKTFGGQLEILKNKLSDIKENIGNALLPILSSLTEAFGRIIDSPAFQKAVDFVTGKLGELSTWIETNIPKWEEKFNTWMTNIGVWWNEKAKPALIELRDFLFTDIPEAIDTAKESWVKMSDVLEAEAIPVGNELEKLYQNIATILELMGINIDKTSLKLALLNLSLTLTTATGKATHNILKSITTVIMGVNNVLEAVIDNWDKLTEAVRNAFNAMNQMILPWWLTPGSPTPLENGLGGIDNALNSINTKSLPKFASNLDVNVTNQTPASNFDYNKFAKVVAMELSKATG